MASDGGGRTGRWGWWAGVACVAPVVLAAAVAGASGPAAYDEPLVSVVRWVELEAAPGAISSGAGSAVTRSHIFEDGSSEDGLWVDVEGLRPLARYELVLDGSVAAAFATDAHGRGSVALLSDGEGLPSRPVASVNRIGAVAVRTTDGAPALSGDLRQGRLHVNAPPDEAPSSD
jgi:hypothetical protein